MDAAHRSHGALAARLSLLGPSIMGRRFAALALARERRQVELGLDSVASSSFAAIKDAAARQRTEVILQAYQEDTFNADRWAAAIAWQRLRASRDDG